MLIDAISVQLRPRSMNEAIDLGVRLVQAHARSVWASFVPLYLIVVVIALASAAVADWLPTLIVFWLKPWLDRTLLFVLSRAVFGTPTRLADVWAARRTVWWEQLWSSLTMRRLSPWRAYVQPVLQLEGQRGAAWRARRKQLLRGKRGAALGMQTIFGNFELLLMASAMLLVVWLTPEPSQSNVFAALFQAKSAGSSVVIQLAYFGAVLLLEPFYVGAGFAMYLNRRVELEAWDIEQEFRLAFAG